MSFVRANQKLSRAVTARAIGASGVFDMFPKIAAILFALPSTRRVRDFATYNLFVLRKCGPAEIVVFNRERHGRVEQTTVAAAAELEPA